MADIAASNVTYTEKPATAMMLGVGRQRRIFTIAFGDGALTYGAGGIPLLASKLGMAAGLVEEVVILDASDDGSPTGFWTWDYETNKLRGFVTTNLATELSGALAATSLVIRVVGA